MVVITGVTCRWQGDGDFLVAISTDDGIVTGIGASSSDPITSPVPMHELPQARWLFSECETVCWQERRRRQAVVNSHD